MPFMCEELNQKLIVLEHLGIYIQRLGGEY